MSISKALIVRSSQLLQFYQAYQEVRKEFDEIYVLSQSGYEDELVQNTGLPKTHILTYPYSEPFRLKHLKKYFSSIFPNKFDCCVILYNNLTGSGYFHVKLIPFLIKARELQVYFLDGTHKKYGIRGFAFNFIKELIFETVDQLVSLTLVVSWLIVIYPVSILLSVLGKIRKNRDEKRIYFFSSQGIDYPSARVRCFDFADQLQKRGFSCKVFSPTTSSLAEELLDAEKVWLSIKLFLKTVFLPHGFLYIQKAKYNSLTPFMLHLLKGWPLILDMDDWEFPTPAFRYLICEHLFLRIAPRACFLVAASHKLQEMMKIFHSHVYLVPTGVDTQKFFPMPKKTTSCCTFGWVGIIFGHPILENILAVVKALKIVPPDIPLVVKIAGKGVLWPALKDYVSKENRVHLCGWVEHNSIPNFMASIDVGLMPLARSTAFLEAKSPTKLFEYMAMGMPTISSPIGEIPYIIEHGKNGFLAATKEEFAHYMKVLAQDAVLRENMGHEAYMTIKQKYSLEMIGNILGHILT